VQVVRTLPAPDPEGQEDASHGHERAPADAPLAVRRHEERRQERTKRRSSVAAHLKDRLRESVLTARRHPGDAMIQDKIDDPTPMSAAARRKQVGQATDSNNSRQA
jgi:hypothetical protein